MIAFHSLIFRVKDHSTIESLFVKRAFVLTDEVSGNDKKLHKFQNIVIM